MGIGLTKSKGALSLFAKGRYLQMIQQPISLVDVKSEHGHEFGVRYHLTDKVRISYSWGIQQTRLALKLPNLPPLPLSFFDIHQQLALGAEF